MNLKDRIKAMEQTEETLSDLLGLAVDGEYDGELVRWVRTRARELGGEAGLNILRRSYVIGGRHSFDDYMIACEWDREPKARFWLPRRKVLEGQHGIASRIQEFIDSPEALYLGFSMPPGTGKALANDTPILTSAGWKKHGDLVVGDEVIGMDGKFKKVIAVHPKCMLDRQFEFTNGEKIVCHARHEWLLYDRARGSMRLEETQEWEKRALETGGVGRGHRYILQVPHREAVEGEHKDLHVDPYLLGVWLGDGVNKNPTICGAKEDRAIIEKIVQMGAKISWATEHKTTGVMYYGIKGLRQRLQEYGMCHSRRRTEKHIPIEYMTAPINERLELLAGLIDTDGTYEKSGKYIFTTSDTELKETFIQLVSTFGWRCCVIEVAPTMSTSGIQGKKTHWRIQFVADREIPCVLERKKTKKITKQRKIAVKSISKVEACEGNCITVEGGMYLAGETMIPTHNTTLIKFLLAYIEGKYPDSASMYVSYSDGMTKMMLDSERAILTDTTEYCHNEIFPENGMPDISAEYKTISHRRAGDFPTLGLVSLGGSVTGRTRANKFLVTDDLVKNAEQARSPEQLEKLYHDYKDTLTTRMIGDTVKEIQLGTIWSAHDPISRRKSENEGDPRYQFITIPVCDEDGRSNFCYEHPDRYTDDRIANLKRELDPVTFSCLYMQRGIEREGLAFPADELKYYNGVLPDGEPDVKAFTCDVAWGGGDSLAMPIAYKYGGDVYVVDVVFNKGDKTVTKPEVTGRILRHGLQKGQFEANNGGDEYADDVSEAVKEAGCRCAISTKKAPTTMGKLTRIEQYAPDIKNMYFLEPAVAGPEYRKFMTEVTTLSYTTKNLHDDAPDSLAMLAEYLLGRTREVGVFRRPF